LIPLGWLAWGRRPRRAAANVFEQAERGRRVDGHAVEVMVGYAAVVVAVVGYAVDPKREIGRSEEDVGLE